MLRRLLVELGREHAQDGSIYSYSSVLNLVASTVKANKATTAYANIFIGP